MFNLYLEPLIQAIRSKHSIDKIIIEEGENLSPITFNIQAYADDVILLSNTQEGMQRMLDTVNEFANMSLVVNKCQSLSYALSGRNRVSSEANLVINNQTIPALPLTACLTYIGAPLAGTKTPKKMHARIRMVDIFNQAIKVMESELKFNQKIDAIKRLITPQLDYEMLNGVCPKGELKSLDKKD
ncbi:hypothetical protein TRFO_07113 [Tritrichomonas foetus]|uniref:Reverse transcriptase domain-containing protein n=1 Tax=Tritrichomonas foetus TaxID=1144522 RepID=A0A1J4JUB6_9EUKA|nr:hypothetical protein TRFO_07113 [Tritrichomonas foetus]|eukprot:OHT02306.1 hypothetical protein TRFO_07113 [Tritrichomonas foetus]